MHTQQRARTAFVRLLNLNKLCESIQATHIEHLPHRFSAFFRRTVAFECVRWRAKGTRSSPSVHSHRVSIRCNAELPQGYKELRTMRGLPVRLWGRLRRRSTEGPSFILKQSVEACWPHSTQCLEWPDDHLTHMKKSKKKHHSSAARNGSAYDHSPGSACQQISPIRLSYLQRNMLIVQTTELFCSLQMFCHWSNTFSERDDMVFWFVTK